MKTWVFKYKDVIFKAYKFKPSKHILKGSNSMKGKEKSIQEGKAYKKNKDKQKGSYINIGPNLFFQAFPH